MTYQKNATLRVFNHGGFVVESYPITINVCGEQSFWFPFGWINVWFENHKIIDIEPNARDYDDLDH
jgi:hypothetical protein